MTATNEQVQAFADQRMRPRCEAIRNLYLACKDDKAVIDDVYANVAADPPSTWQDSRSDHPPHLLTPANVLSWNAFITAFIAFVEGDGNYATVEDACVRGVG